MLRMMMMMRRRQRKRWQRVTLIGRSWRMKTR
jgi:hypothetical protein